MTTRISCAARINRELARPAGVSSLKGDSSGGARMLGGRPNASFWEDVKPESGYDPDDALKGREQS